MLMPSIFGENLFNNDWMDFSFPDVDKVLYGKHAKNVMKTDVKETDISYEVDIDLPGFKKDEIEAKLENGYLTISAAKGLDKEEKDKKDGKYIRKAVSQTHLDVYKRQVYDAETGLNVFKFANFPFEKEELKKAGKKDIIATKNIGKTL